MPIEIYRIIMIAVVALLFLLVVYKLIRLVIHRNHGEMNKAKDCLRSILIYTVGGFIVVICAILVSHIAK